MQTDLPENQAGAAIAGRLKGAAFQFAMGMGALRLDMNTAAQRMIEAPELFAEPAHEAWTSPGGREFPAEIGGAQLLVRGLRDEFGGDNQDLQWSTLESFFELFRGQASMEDYCSLHDLAYTDYNGLCNLQMNDIGRSYFLLKEAN